MKKCLIFFTLLLFTIGIAVLTEENEPAVSVNEVAMGETAANDLLSEEPVLSLD